MKQKLERPILISLQLRIVGLADSTADSVIGATEAVTTMPPSEVRAYVLFFSYCAKSRVSLANSRLRRLALKLHPVFASGRGDVH